jgi:GAF domain-containing protein
MTLRVRALLLVNGLTIAAILVAVATNIVARQSTSTQLVLTVIAAIALLVLGSAAAIVAVQTLERPLARLMEVVRLMELGNLSPEQAAQIKATPGQDEVSRLSQAFGQMAYEVTLRLQEVEQRNKELQTVYQVTRAMSGNNLDPEATLIYQEVKQRNTELQTAYKMAQAITASSVDSSETLQTILERLEPVIPYDAGEVCLYAAESNALRVEAWRGPEGFDSRGRFYPIGEGFTGWVGQHRHSLLVSDVEKHPTIKAAPQQVGNDLFVHSFMAVPLIAGDRLIGAVQFLAAQPERFDRHMQRLVETIAPQAATAIETAQRVAARERLLKEEIAQLKIQIDQVKKERQVAQITETDYFQQLQKKAQELKREKS